MLKTILFSLLFVMLLASTALAQKVYTPEKGSKQRKVILNTLRKPVQKELKQKILFLIDDFNVSGKWAFISGEPLAKDGGKPDYRNTIYQEAVDSDMFDNNFFALLKKSDKKWRVVK